MAPLEEGSGLLLARGLREDGFAGRAVKLPETLYGAERGTPEELEAHGRSGGITREDLDERVFHATKRLCLAGLQAHAVKDDLAKLAHRFDGVVKIAVARPSARNDEIAFGDCALEQGSNGSLVIFDDRIQLDFASHFEGVCTQHVCVRVSDLAGLGLCRGLDELGANADDANLGPGIYGNDRIAGAGKQTDGRGTNHLARAYDDIASLGLLSGFAHIGLGHGRANPHALAHAAVTGEGRVLDLDHGIGSFGHDSARHDADCLARCERDLAHDARADPVDDLEFDGNLLARAFEGRGNHGKPVHSRVIEGRHVDVARKIGGGNTSDRGKQIDFFDRHPKTRLARELDRPATRLVDADHVLAHFYYPLERLNELIIDRVSNLAVKAVFNLPIGDIVSHSSCGRRARRKTVRPARCACERSPWTGLRKPGRKKLHLWVLGFRPIATSTLVATDEADDDDDDRHGQKRDDEQGALRVKPRDGSADDG